jgi:hypothetical protein
VPKIALPKFWLANILVELFLAHKLVNIGYKNELDLVVEHWQAKKLATIQTRTNLLVMTKKIGRVCFGSNPNRPSVFLFGSRNVPHCSTRQRYPTPSVWFLSMQLHLLFLVFFSSVNTF